MQPGLENASKGVDAPTPGPTLAAPVEPGVPGDPSHVLDSRSDSSHESVVNVSEKEESWSPALSLLDAVSGDSDEKSKASPKPRPKCPHGKRKEYCFDCNGSGICPHRKRRQTCIDCGGAGICIHKKQKRYCIPCGGSAMCEHKREKSKCVECGGSSICVHKRQRINCVDCGGSQVKRRDNCKFCRNSGKRGNQAGQAASPAVSQSSAAARVPKQLLPAQTVEGVRALLQFAYQAESPPLPADSPAAYPPRQHGPLSLDYSEHENDRIPVLPPGGDGISRPTSATATKPSYSPALAQAIQSGPTAPHQSFSAPESDSEQRASPYTSAGESPRPVLARRHGDLPLFPSRDYHVDRRLPYPPTSSLSPVKGEYLLEPIRPYSSYYAAGQDYASDYSYSPRFTPYPPPRLSPRPALREMPIRDKGYSSAERYRTYQDCPSGTNEHADHRQVFTPPQEYAQAFDYESLPSQPTLPLRKQSDYGVRQESHPDSYRQEPTPKQAACVPIRAIKNCASVEHLAGYADLKPEDKTRVLEKFKQVGAVGVHARNELQTDMDLLAEAAAIKNIISGSVIDAVADAIGHSEAAESAAFIASEIVGGNTAVSTEVSGPVSAHPAPDLCDSLVLLAEAAAQCKPLDCDKLSQGKTAAEPRPKPKTTKVSKKTAKRAVQPPPPLVVSKLQQRSLSSLVIQHNDVEAEIETDAQVPQ
ncbi:hypothetical protein HDV03_002857 [Kappamyces sp. JEL0829]|nr:hypothetical protein HDV03_002857 [Kappamyces sp. JEL0829]